MQQSRLWRLNSSIASSEKAISAMFKQQLALKLEFFHCSNPQISIPVLGIRFSSLPSQQFSHNAKEIFLRYRLLEHSVKNQVFTVIFPDGFDIG